MSNRTFRQNIARTSGEGNVTVRVEVWCGPCQINIKQPHQSVHFRIGTLNDGTMKGRATEITKTVAHKHIDWCCLQETRWRDSLTRKTTGKDCLYKFFWSGDLSGLGGVGILLTEQWIDKALSVVRIDHWIMILSLLVAKITISIFWVYTPQCDRPCEEKDDFYSVLLSSISTISPNDVLIICGDLLNHIGKDSR